MGVRAPEGMDEIELHRPQRIGPTTASAVGLALVLVALLLSNGRPILPPGDWSPAARQPAALAGKAAASLLCAAAAALLFLAVGRRHPAEPARLTAVFLALGMTVWAASQAWNDWALSTAI